jgi:16S rRNA (guanine527-N7)-methyltransferase
VAIQALLDSALIENGYHFSSPLQDKLIQYLELLQKWNKIFNLTAIDSPDKMIYLHILDSLSIQPYLHGTKMLDVGSGAGFPGIPLAIVDPNKTWVLIDKSRKKTNFLTQAIAELNLKNVTVVHERCENFHSQQCFDSIVSRAFGTINLLLESTQHLICPQGHFLAMKGNYPQEEIDELPKRFTLLSVEKLTIKGMEAQRHLVIISEVTRDD